MCSTYVVFHSDASRVFNDSSTTGIRSFGRLASEVGHGFLFQ